MDEYLRYADLVEKTAARINERFPDSIDLYTSDDFDRTVGAYCVYDVLLVNSIMDGMNLVSKEGPAVNRKNGALVLSTRAGSFFELGDEAVPIQDPYDIDENARALESAIDMSLEERKRRGDRLRTIVEGSKPETWIETQIEDLARVQSGEEPLTPPDTSRSL